MRRMLVTATICLAAMGLWSMQSACADTIRLTNGYAIHGKVVAEHPQSETHIRVEFSNGGWMLLSKPEVAEITPDNTDQFENRNAGVADPVVEIIDRNEEDVGRLRRGR